MTQALADNPVKSDSVYARLGGEPAVRSLVQRLYELMEELPDAYTVRRIHPPTLAGSADSLFKFLSGWFGGPNLYIRERGHPRLRMRQAPGEQVDDPALRSMILKAFADMAQHMVNVRRQQPTAIQADRSGRRSLSHLPC